MIDATSSEQDTVKDGTNDKAASSANIKPNKRDDDPSRSTEYYVAGQGFGVVSARDDFHRAMRGIPHTWRIAIKEIRGRYARSALGPFWLVIGTVSFILAFAVMGSVLLRVPWQAYMPYLAVGVIFWAFFSTYWIESTNMFITASSQMTSMRTSILDIMLRNILRNLIIFAHSVPVLLCVCVIFSKEPILWLWIMPGFFALIFFVMPIGLFLGILASRYRDTVSAVATFLTFAIYLTPVWWLSASVKDPRARIIIDYNPLYHLLNVVREPWLGAHAPLISWIVVCGTGLFFWLITIWVYVKYRNRIPLWL